MSSSLQPLRHTLSRLPRPAYKLRAPLDTFLRTYTNSPSLSAGSDPGMFRPGPSPPRLSEAEQRIFEDLQRHSTGAFSTPRPLEEQIRAVDRSIAEIEAETDLLPDRSRPRPQVNQPSEGQQQLREEQGLPHIDARVKARGEGEELHPDVRRGARPEFEGETNPLTGEIGGPKNEPLRWGGDKDWSYNGRVSDF